MDKVKIKIKIDQLEVLNGLIASFDISHINKAKQQKATISVLNLVSKRLRKLEITKEYALKPFIIKFHYHEAFFYRISLIIIYTYIKPTRMNLMYCLLLILKSINN